MNNLITISSRLIRRAFPAIQSVRLTHGNNHILHSPTESELTELQYDKVSTETLDKFAEVFEILGEQHDLGDVYDVLHDYGVLKVEFGPPIGTYIINRQAPNKQLWLSSPRSGPKRYDYVGDKGEWVYKHDGTSLHRLLDEEISAIVGHPVKFPKK